MDAALKAIEAASLASALRSSLYAYPLISALHIAAIGVFFGSLLFIHGRTFGWFPAFESRASEYTSRRAALAGFATAAVTGLALFSVSAVEYAANPAFLAKMVLLALAGLNFGVWIAWPGIRRVTSLISAFLWIAILIAGRFIGFV